MKLSNITPEAFEDGKKLIALVEDYLKKYNLRHLGLSVIIYDDDSSVNDLTIYDDNVSMGNKDIGYFTHEIKSDSDKVVTEFHKF